MTIALPDQTLTHSRAGTAAESGAWSWKSVFLIFVVGIVWNILLISIPGFYSHDELDWQNRILRHNDPWTFGLGSFTDSPFFRLLGSVIISRWLRIPMQPIGSHLVEVLIAIATACLLYRAVSLFRPDRALAAAILFMLMPSFAFSAGWIAAGFDILYAFFGVWSVLCAILYWRGGHWIHLIMSVAAFAAALGCKETALSIPICAALVMFIDRARMDLRRAAILAALVTAILALYFGLNFSRLARMSASGGGGYKFGGGWNFLGNMVPYFSFPFAPNISEIGGLGAFNSSQLIRSVAPHVVLLGLILWRGGPTWLVLYLIAFYATLLPVLPISKYETQYTYAGSIALAIALTMLWDRRWTVALPVAVLALLLVDHNFAVQRSMYESGGCQTRALDTLKAVLPSVPPASQPMVLISDAAPWWIIARALHDNSFPLRGKLAEVSVTRDPEKATMVFHNDCTVTAKTEP